MPIIDHNNATEVPWRPNYRKWLITEEGDGTTAIDASVSEVGIGTGAPLHTHEDDELIVILEGTLRVRIGDETHGCGSRSHCRRSSRATARLRGHWRLPGANSGRLSSQGPLPSHRVSGGRAARGPFIASDSTYSSTRNIRSRKGTSDSTGIGAMLPSGGCQSILNRVDRPLSLASYSMRTG